MSNIDLSLTKEDYLKLIQIIYKTSDMEANHSTSWMDEYNSSIVTEKIKEIIRCKEPVSVFKHSSCLLLKKVLFATQQFKKSEKGNVI